jgi:sec-independent protein translocase protein TatB
MTLLLLDIGTGELIALVVLAALLLGPDKVPGLAKKAARVIRFLKKVANNATDQIKSELGPDYADLSISDLKPKNLIQRVLPADMHSELDVLRSELDGMRTEMARLQLRTQSDIRRGLAAAPAVPPPPDPAPQPVAEAEPTATAEAADQAWESTLDAVSSSAKAASEAAADSASSLSMAKPF